MVASLTQTVPDGFHCSCHVPGIPTEYQVHAGKCLQIRNIYWTPYALTNVLPLLELTALQLRSFIGRSLISC